MTYNFDMTIVKTFTTYKLYYCYFVFEIVWQNLSVYVTVYAELSKSLSIL